MRESRVASRVPNDERAEWNADAEAKSAAWRGTAATPPVERRQSADGGRARGARQRAMGVVGDGGAQPRDATFDGERRADAEGA